MVQCQMRDLQPGQINPFRKWKELGRIVKRGERALILCMPIMRKCRDEEAESNGDDANGERTFTSFMHKARWFVISQTVGDEFTPPRLPEREAERALAALNIEPIAFTDMDGNCQGYARLCCRQHKRAYVAKSVMWRRVVLRCKDGRSSICTPHKFSSL